MTNDESRMTEDRDKVEKGAAKKALMEGLYRDRVGRISSLDKARIEQSIDALKPEPGAEAGYAVHDAVSKSSMYAVVECLKRSSANDYWCGWNMALRAVHDEIAKRPLVLPARAGRSEKEIRVAIEYLRTCRMPFDPAVVAQILEYASGIEGNPEPCIRDIFSACSERSESVLPARAGRSEQEIGRAIDFITKNAESSDHEVRRLTYSHRDVVQILKAGFLGENNQWASLFSEFDPPDPAGKEGGTSDG